ncbi:MAG: hypothetical protein ACR2QK_23365, partial [Acidimicrobiales bacterium]
MADLFDEVVVFVTRDEILDAQAEELGLASRAPVRDGAVLSAAVVIAGFARWLPTPRGAGWLRVELPTVDPTSIDRFVELSHHRDHHRFGTSVVAQLLGDRRDEIVTQVASQSGLGHDDAAAVLSSSAWATVIHMARQQSRPTAVDDLATRLDQQAVE